MLDPSFDALGGRPARLTREGVNAKPKCNAYPMTLGGVAIPFAEKMSRIAAKTE